MKQGVIVQWSIPGDRIPSFIEIVLEASPISISTMHFYDDSAAPIYRMKRHVAY